MRRSSSASGYPSVVLTKKRSSWASGSGNVPSYSIGFCVARTRNGSSRRRVSPSTVTCCSAIASSSADWVFGIARLISSTRTTFAKTGPGRNSKSRSFWLKIERPVTSVGCRSGVHWMRLEREPSTEPAIARASTVFAVPGTSSRSAWPPHMSAARTSLICSRLPCTTVSMLSRKRSAMSVAEVSSSADTHDLRGHRDGKHLRVRRFRLDLDCLSVVRRAKSICNLVSTRLQSLGAGRREGVELLVAAEEPPGRLPLDKGEVAFVAAPGPFFGPRHQSGPNRVQDDVPARLEQVLVPFDDLATVRTLKEVAYALMPGVEPARVAAV